MEQDDIVLDWPKYKTGKQKDSIYFYIALVPSLGMLFGLHSCGLLNWLSATFGQNSVMEELTLIPIAILASIPAFVLLPAVPSRIQLSGGMVHVKYWVKQREFPTHAIRSYRRNWLGEWLLYDEDGKRLLTVPYCMTNLDEFKDWLECRGIEQR